MYQLGKHLLNPYFLVLAFLGLLLVNLWYRRRESRGRLLALTVGYIGLVTLSFPLFASLARTSLENQYPRLNERPPDIQAIVVIDGGEGHSIQRCELAAKLYRQGTPCPVVVSSSPDTPDFAPVQAMREHLLLMGVQPSDLVEDSSAQNTHENAVRSWALLEPRSIRKVILVTDAIHMPRAAACFRKQGFEVVAAGCDYEQAEAPRLFNYLPSSRAINVLGYAAQEWLGLAWYRIKGRV